MQPGCIICELVATEDFAVFETKYWKITVAPKQPVLGRLFVTARHHRTSLSELTTEEWVDLQHVIKQSEQTLTKAFEPELFNWSCLMNDAYQEAEPLPHVHWHVRPRYRQPVSFQGREFADPEFGRHYVRNRDEDHIASNELRLAIRDSLRHTYSQIK